MATTGIIALLFGAATPACAGIIAEDGYGEAVIMAEDVSATGDADAGTVLSGQPVAPDGSVPVAPDAMVTGLTPARSQA